MAVLVRTPLTRTDFIEADQIKWLRYTQLPGGNCTPVYRARKNWTGSILRRQMQSENNMELSDGTTACKREHTSIAPLAVVSVNVNQNNYPARKYLIFTVEAFNQLRNGNSRGQALFSWYVNTDRCKVVAINFCWVSTATETYQVVVITNDNTTVASYPSSIASPLLSLHLKETTERAP